MRLALLLFAISLPAFTGEFESRFAQIKHKGVAIDRCGYSTNNYKQWKQQFLQEQDTLKLECLEAKSTEFQLEEESRQQGHELRKQHIEEMRQLDCSNGSGTIKKICNALKAIIGE